MREEIKTRASRPGQRAVPALKKLQAAVRIRQYELIRELGSGGMGVVWLARDTRLGRRVAIKFLLAQERDLIDGFLREARATAACQHENIVVIHEVDDGEDIGLPSMVLEYLEGQSLRSFIRGRQLSPHRAVELMLPVARALVRAHELNIVHRDLKPENIFVTQSGTIKVLDFGIASLFSEVAPPGDPTIVETGGMSSLGDDDITNTFAASKVTGTLPYMACEQFSDGGVDARADLWALGIILYELCSGHHPIQPLDSDALWRNAMHLEQPMPRLLDEVPQVPARLSQLVERCLQKRVDKRISSARAVLAELELLLPSRAQRKYGENESPYPGLVAFQEEESDRFFGRGRDVLQVLSRLREHPLAAIIGPSGVGKSSFVRAGVIPALKASGERWEAFVLRPGRQPLTALATMIQPLTTSVKSSIQDKINEHERLVQRLRDEPGYLGAVLRQRSVQRNEKIVLFVDQFEELYTLQPDEAQRRAFVACLSGVADDAQAPLRVVLSLRSDFLDRVGEDKRFADELARSLILLQPLGREQLREALKAPIEQLGHTFESQLMIEEMVAALATTPGALPLLQFAGSMLWEARDQERKMLTHASYMHMGGISGVLAQHADQVVHALSPPTQKLVRSLFQRLITAEGTRAIVEISELADLATDPKEVRTLVDHLVEARLLVVQARGAEDSATVELVHESLLTSWPLLRRWLEEGRDDAAFREQLRAAARQWHSHRRDEGLLWRGEAMEEARIWRARHSDALPSNEQQFLDAVFALANRAERLQRFAVIGTIALLTFVIALGTVALVQVRRAERRAIDQAQVARHEAERAREAETRVQAQLDTIRNEQEARTQAQKEVARGKEDLRVVNAELEQALEKANAESARAKSAASGEHKAAESLKDTNAKLQQLLAQERARSEKLEKERKKITTELR
jgi:serine/threonine protein kinase